MGGNNKVIAHQQAAIQQTVTRLLWLLFAMGLFTAALVPLYQVFCDLTGLNGKSYGLLTRAEFSDQQSSPLLAGTARNIQFVTQVGAGLAVTFKAYEKQQNILPGGKRQVMFLFRNMTADTQLARAVPSVSPAQASQHLLKIECFCFQQLELKPYETLEIPLIYLLSAAVPENVKQLTLAYNLYPVESTDNSLVNGG